MLSTRLEHAPHPLCCLVGFQLSKSQFWGQILPFRLDSKEMACARLYATSFFFPHPGNRDLFLFFVIFAAHRNKRAVLSLPSSHLLDKQKPSSPLFIFPTPFALSIKTSTLPSRSKMAAEWYRRGMVDGFCVSNRNPITLSLMLAVAYFL